MARIAGVDLPREKRVEIGLTYIYGIGRTSSNRILAEAKVDPNTRVRDLTDDEVKRISAVIDESQTVEGDLRREIAMNIKRLQETDAIVESVTEKVFRFVVRRQRPMQEPERDRSVRLLTRRSNYFCDFVRRIATDEVWRSVAYNH